MVPSDAVTAVLCSRVSDVVIIVASAFKNLSDHENTLAGVSSLKKKVSSVITGVQLARSYPSKQAFINKYSINSTFAWKACLFL